MQIQLIAELPLKIWKQAYPLLLRDHFRTIDLFRTDSSQNDTWCLYELGEDQLLQIGIVTVDPDFDFAFLHGLGSLPGENARSFFLAVENFVREKGAKFLFIDHELTDPRSPAFCSQLQEAGFSTPQIISEQYRIDVRTFYPPWKENRRWKYSSPDFEEFPWSSISAEEREYVEGLEMGSYYSSEVSPFLEYEKMEPANSLGLRWKDRVVGWMITFREDRETICYDALYVDHRYTVNQDALTLLVHSIQKQQATDIPWSTFSLSLMRVNATWNNFVRKRLVPYACEKRLFASSTKTILTQ